MRVIAGTAGSIPLSVPKGPEIRPTQDKVRGAVFSMLGDRVAGAAALDLFAGTGALGIEALSRGAASCVFVEKDRKCMAALQANLAKTRTAPGATTLLCDAWAGAARVSGPFDLIFADPPYFKSAPPSAATAFHAALARETARLLAPDGVLVYEHFFKTDPDLGPAFTRLKQKIYGETGVTLFTLTPASPPTENTAYTGK